MVASSIIQGNVLLDQLYIQLSVILDVGPSSCKLATKAVLLQPLCLQTE